MPTEKKLAIYVAGPVTGTTDYFERFVAGCVEVRELGHEPVSPVHSGDDGPTGDNWLHYTKRGIRELLQCDGIYCLRDWHQSRGARIEHFIADALGLLVLYQPEKENT
jgi:hypothetical protein